MAEDAPRLSVIVPSHNRGEQLRATLQALARQDLPPASFEVIVALDATTDGSEAMLAFRPWPFALRSVVPATRGAGGARNAGAAQARGERLVFLDDDIIVAEGFLKAHLEAGGGDPNAVVVGYSAPVTRRKGWFEQGLHSWWHELFTDMERPGRRFGYTDLLSGNFSLARSLFDRIGRFDESFACREDYELGYRLVHAGAELRFCREAAGDHHDNSDLARSLRRAQAEGAADARLALKHPEVFPRLMLSRLTAPFWSATTLRRAIFRWRKVGDLARIVALALMAPLRLAGARTLWERLHHSVRFYSYYRGAAVALGDEAAFWKAARAVPQTSSRTIDLDVEDGQATLEQRMIDERPDGFVLRCADWIVAEAPAVPGLEPPRPHHLRVYLEATKEQWSQAVAAAKALPPLPAPSLVPLGQYASAQPGSPALGAGEVDIADWSVSPAVDTLTLPARLLVRRRGTPLDWIHLEPAPGSDRWAAIRSAILHKKAIRQALLWERAVPEANPLAEAPPPSPVTVVICTRDRTDNLRRCLEAVRQLDYPDFEVLVVDNAPQTDETEKLVRTMPGVRYVREDRPGLDWARNRGIAEAGAPLVAFTDDDTRVDRHWLTALNEAFAQPEVMAVTGLVTPMSLDTPARQYFELVYGGMGKGFAPRWWRRAQIGDVGLLWASGCGVGANMAFRRSIFARIGGFDPALDVGTVTRGGGDIEMFHRLLAAGHMLVYQPGAIIWHEHRADFAALTRQLEDNGSGFVAYLLACARNRTVGRVAIVKFVLQDWIRGWLVSRMIRPGVHRRAMVIAEIRGALRGVNCYRKARKHAASLARTGESVSVAPATLAQS